jgi:hypothetical protein
VCGTVRTEGNVKGKCSSRKGQGKANCIFYLFFKFAEFFVFSLNTSIHYYFLNFVLCKINGDILI